MDRKQFLNRPDIVTEINRLMRTNSRSNLIDMCNEKQIQMTGTKHDMATRIVLARNNIIESRETVVDKLRRQRQEIRLLQLKDGHFLYAELNLVFHGTMRRVFCRHDGDATDGVPKQYLPLRESDIEYCRLWKLPYIVPEQPVGDIQHEIENDDPKNPDEPEDEPEDDDDDLNDLNDPTDDAAHPAF